MNKLMTIAAALAVTVFGAGCATEQVDEEEMGESNSAIAAGQDICIPRNMKVYAAHDLQLRKGPSPDAGSIRVVQGNEWLTPRGSLCSQNGFLLVTDAGGNTGYVWTAYLGPYYGG